MDAPPDLRIDYQQLVAEGLLGVVRRVLVSVAEDGLPGAHHFFLTFETDAEGVEISQALRHGYPREMTVVLQHRFYDLAVDDNGFAVTLEFGGGAERLRVPWTALTAFVDPAAEVGFRFGSQAAVAEAADAPGEGQEQGGIDNVVPLDRFRRPPRGES